MSCAGLIAAICVLLGLSTGNPLMILFALALVWEVASSVIELFGILIVALLAVRFLNQRKYYSISVALAVLFFLISLPFGRASYYHVINLGAPPGTNPSSYRPLHQPLSRYFLDETRVYCDDEKLTAADVNTLTGVKHCTQTKHHQLCGEDVTSIDYAKDKSNVFYECAMILRADPETFVLSSFDYAKDKNHVYYSGKILENADTASFATISWEEDSSKLGYDAQDKNHKYWMGKIVQ